MISTKKLVFSLFICVTVPLAVNAQNGWSDADFGVTVAKSEFKAKRVIPPSIEAAELGKYGNTPISLFTGTPKVSIPLVELKGQKLSLPISLSYNGSGFKPDDVATWVGQGWSLNAGGVVTKSVSGDPDRSYNYFNVQYIVPPVNDLMASYRFFDSVRRGYIEIQPDNYYYNFPGGSGKFWVKPDHSLWMKEHRPITISEPSDASITITDENGTTYVFSEIEYTQVLLDDSDTETPRLMSYGYTSSWYITSITSADNTETINFTYHSCSQKHINVQNPLPNESYSYSQKAGAAMLGTGHTAAMPPQVEIFGKKYISQIKFFKNGVATDYIDFESVANSRTDLPDINFPGERKLTAVKQYTRNSLDNGWELLKHFNLVTDYFNGSSGLTRLRLKEVQEQPVDGITQAKPAHKFDYNTSVPLPWYDGSGIDHWGFFNGGSPNSIIPNYNLNTLSITAENRAPSLDGSSAGILNKITYPTGGYTTFEYELHQAKANQIDLVAEPVGGLRIKTLKDFAADGVVATAKQYEYVAADGSPSGIATFPEYLSISESTNYPDLRFNSSAEITFSTNYSISASGVGALGTLQGSHIGYKRVVEKTIDLSNNQPLGATIYEYNIESINGYDDHVGNGDLIKQQAYDNGGKLLAEITMEYSYINRSSLAYRMVKPSPRQDNLTILCVPFPNDPNSNIPAWKAAWRVSPICSTSLFSATKYTLGGYGVTAQRKLLTRQTEQRYDQTSNSYVYNEKRYSYDYTPDAANPTLTAGTVLINQPWKTEQLTSNGEWLVTEKLFANNFLTNGTGNAAAQGIHWLRNRNIYGAEIETQQYRKTTPEASPKYVGGSISIYASNNASPIAQWFLETASPLNALAKSSLTANNFSYPASYKLQASFGYGDGNTLIRQQKINDAPIATLYDYANTLPVLEIVNAEPTEIGYSSFETINTPGFIAANLSNNRIAGGFRGQYAFRLGTNAITKNGLNATKVYLVEYWSTGGNVTIVNQAGVSATLLPIGTANNGWIKYRHKLPPGTTGITLSAANIVIDDVLIAPEQCVWSTAVYANHAGILLAKEDDKGQIGKVAYDGYYRPVVVKDESNNILKQFQYNYGSSIAPITAPATSLYYNQVQTRVVSKNNGCPVDAVPLPLTYTVPYGRYAAVTLAAANALAVADLDAEAQAFANAVGKCVYYNNASTGNYSKNDCSPSSGVPVCNTNPNPAFNSFITYTIPANYLYTETSKADANSQALSIRNVQGQAQANSQCWCSCNGEGKKMVNGLCETGTRINSGNTLLSSGMWECTYYYEFSDFSVSQFYYSISSSPCPIY